MTTSIKPESSIDIEITIWELHSASAGGSFLTCDDNSTGVAQPALLHDSSDACEPRFEPQRQDVRSKGAKWVGEAKWSEGRVLVGCLVFSLVHVVDFYAKAVVINFHARPSALQCRMHK